MLLAAPARRPVSTVAALLVVALLTFLTACTGSDSTSESAGGVPPEVGAHDGGGGDDAAEGSAGESGGDAAGEGTAGPAVAGEQVAGEQVRKIRRGAVSVQVDDLARAAALVRDTAAALQGYVSDESIGSVAMADTGVDPAYDPYSETGFTSEPGDVALQPYYGPGEGRLVVRVPSSSMTEAMDAMAALGTELNRWSTEVDVETALVDLESRVETQRASVQRVRALLEQATSLSDVVMLESELSEREADLAALEAQLESLAGRAELATVTVVLRTPDRAAQVQDERGMLAGLRAGWDALAESTVVLMTVVGALLPFAVVAAVLGLPLVLWRRRARRDRGQAAAGAGATTAAAPPA